MNAVIPATTLAAVALAAVLAFAPKDFDMAMAKAVYLDIASPAHALSLPVIR
ncbi:MAG: hypothetical protein AAF192_21880 [Pseudomonadota bacterium]